eukprot:Tamp_14722.p5 GENE.Tamp_14722~~Tamp_14722.p5  ORF type:complete len:136 (+),score=22.81 Tamp_14722:838-1245(+)
MEYHFICDAGIKGVGEPETVAGECRFIIIWQTKYACAYYPNGTSLKLMSWWGVIALAVYLAAGFVYNVAGKGLPLHPSSIPHSEAWEAGGILAWEAARAVIKRLAASRSSAGPKYGIGGEEATSLNPPAAGPQTL